MQTESFFERLGHVLGNIIRVIVDTLSHLLSGLGGAVRHFAEGLAGSLGMQPSLIHFALLVLGLLFLIGAVRAFLGRSLLGGILWLVIAIFILSGLIH